MTNLFSTGGIWLTSTDAVSVLLLNVLNLQVGVAPGKISVNSQREKSLFGVVDPFSGTTKFMAPVVVSVKK